MPHRLLYKVQKTRENFDTVFLERYNRLNNQQKQAVDTIDGPVVVIAGPGSGKTELLSLRVANILRQTDTTAKNILCLTFTEAAATNMRGRLLPIVGTAAYDVGIYTFHGFASDVAARYPDLFPTKDGGVITDVAQLSLVENIIRKRPYTCPIKKMLGTEHSTKVLKEIITAIDDLKKADLSPERFSHILTNNAKAYQVIEESGLAEAFSSLRGKATIVKIEAFLSQCVQNTTNFSLQHNHWNENLFLPYATLFLKALEEAVNEAQVTNKTAPLSAFKDAWLRRDDDKNVRLRASLWHKKMESLAEIYREYQNYLEKEGKNDFGSMLMNLTNTLRTHPSLVCDLQEQYQYILVDEFQDTNDVQLTIITTLADPKGQEGQPNIMVVGDDDQAIYRFQGADVGNILTFLRLYPQAQRVVLTQNYRSGKKIVKIARQICLLGEQRLENTLPNMTKDLAAANSEMGEGSISHHVFPNPLAEQAFIVEKIAALLANGRDPSTIAVIARDNRSLMTISAALLAKGISVSYERKNNILDLPLIKELLLLLRCAHTMAKEYATATEELLPTILSFPFWGLPTDTIYRLSIDVEKQRVETGKKQSWITTILNSNNQQLHEIITFLLNIAALTSSHTLPTIIEYLVGKTPLGTFTSPFLSYYCKKHTKKTSFAETMSACSSSFPPKENTVNCCKVETRYPTHQTNTKDDMDIAIYGQFLSALNTLFETVMSYAGKDITEVTVADIVECVVQHEKYSTPIADNTNIFTTKEGVALVTAHKSKGLEYNTVFLLSAVESVWAKGAQGKIIMFPENLPIAAAGDTSDDHMRLFFVAVTRARKELFITSFTSDGKNDILPLRFITAPPVATLLPPVTEETASSISHQALILTQESIFSPLRFTATDISTILAPKLTNYRLSATHLTAFCDVSHGGPQAFVHNHLLRFPMAKRAESLFGTAIHHVIKKIFEKITAEKNATSIQELTEEAQKILYQNLWRTIIDDHERKELLMRGENTLNAFIPWAITYWEQLHKNDKKTMIICEKDFSSSNVFLGDIPITGKIDVLFVSPTKKSVEIADYKTGKPFSTWGKSNEKAHRYRQQLLFYTHILRTSIDLDTYTPKCSIVFPCPPEGKTTITTISFTPKNEEMERVAALASVVYQRILTANFPNTSHYPQTIHGIIQFENDLLAGRI